jgi:tetratricopeptide (TPR) repeat protein
MLGTPGTDQKTERSVSLALAAAAVRSGNIAQARQMLTDRIAQNPSDADALQMLADIAANERSVDEATILLRRAVGVDPSAGRRMALVLHLQRFASPALALAEIEQLPPNVRNEFEVRGIEAALLGVVGMHERQIRLYQQMTRQRPSSARLWVSLSNALKTIGRTDQAVGALRRALKTQPSFGVAYWTLANFKSFRFSAGEILRMRKVLRQKLSEEDELHIHFALGKAYEDRGDYEQSFRHYKAGNAMRAASLGREQISVSTLVDEFTATFTPEFFERNKKAGFDEKGPIFVVGLHRSGSTLIEQILSSHPLVEGTTELNVMNSIRERLVRSRSQTPAAAIASLHRREVRAIGEEYFERTRPFRQTDRPFFVDKMPTNWMNLALIRISLPNARIIDARRHPMACGFSNFKQNYAAGVAFSYALDSIGTFYRDYLRYMRHFDAVQPEAVFRMINEQLVERPEEQVRGMLDYLGLPFDHACLEFHKNDRAVRTPSAEQVRRPINREGVDQWRHYEPWLGELKESLGDALDRWME